MIRFIYFLLTGIFLLPLAAGAQQVTYSEYDREDYRNINFEIVGKMNGNIVVYKYVRWKHRLTIYDSEMKETATVALDFLPENTFNADFITYQDFFYMIYQYKKRNILHCMAVKLDGYGKKMGNPVQLDTTVIPLFGDTKIYSTICSEDKQKIMLFKIQKKWDTYEMVTLLLDDKLQLQHTTWQSLNFDDRHDNYKDFMLDNDGNLVFTVDKREGNRENSKYLNLVTKAPTQDSFVFHPINLDGKYLDEVRLKIDNLNKRYIINSFYCPKSWGSIAGLFTCSWDVVNEKQNASAFNAFDDSFRAEAKTDVQVKFAFDDYFIRQVFIKKDGGFLLTAEDFSSEARNTSNWNRWDYLNSSSLFNANPNSYYTYTPNSQYYRPPGFYNNQSTRFFYANIIVLSVDKNGLAQWGKVIHKDQFADDDDNFLSFSAMNSGDEIHFLYNLTTKNQVIADESVSADGTLKRNATLRSQERGYEFMAQLGKQVGARQLIIPCTYRGYICFAKVVF